MPLRTEYIDFEDEIQGLREDMNDAAERLSQMNEDDPEEIAGLTMREGQQCETYIEFFEDLTAGEVPGMPSMEGVELAGLTSGELDLVDDIVEKHSNMRRRHAKVAIGTRGDAPYLEHDPEDALSVDACEETALQVASLPRPYVNWAAERIGEYSYLSDDRGNAFLALASEKKQEE